jgi:hypothetical protein
LQEVLQEEDEEEEEAMRVHEHPGALNHKFHANYLWQ